MRWGQRKAMKRLVSPKPIQGNSSFFFDFSLASFGLALLVLAELGIGFDGSEAKARPPH
jgi:hypothetical protein